jgi:hypothetical protein
VLYYDFERINMKDENKTPPPPGSDDAIALGCKCPVLDNGHGRGAYIKDGEWIFWYSTDCELHAKQSYIS